MRPCLSFFSTSSHRLYLTSIFLDEPSNQDTSSLAFFRFFRSNTPIQLLLGSNPLLTESSPMDMEYTQVKAEEIEANFNRKTSQHSTGNFASKALSDGSHSESPSPGHKHSWTVEQRLTLALLAESYTNNWNEKTAVFNHYHKYDLRGCGGLRRAVVSTQYNDMRKRFNPADALKKLQATVSPYDRMRLASRAALERKANEIGIRLNAKWPTDSSSHGRISDMHDTQGHKRKRDDLFDDARTDYLPHNESQAPSHLQAVHQFNLLPPPKTPTTINCSRNNGLPTPPDSRGRKLQRLTVDKRLAQIGFRAFTAQSPSTYSPALGIRGELLYI